MDNDPNNDLDLWRTQIFITMQWPEHWMDDILKPGISVFEKKLSEQRGGKKCSLIWKQFKSLIHKTLCCRHNVMLCLRHNLSANSVWLRAALSPSLSLGTHHALLIFPLWVWAAALCSSLFATKLSIITQLP